MKNVIILGAGRSGTSMVAGLFAKAGYFFGGDPYPPRHSNPKGFFETKEVNGVNEMILANITPQRPPVVGNLLFRKRPITGQRWLVKVPLSKDICAPEGVHKQIKVLVEEEPYCFKDPRFSYTLPVWNPYLNNHVFLCVFRDPVTTVTSILKECSDVEYLKSLALNKKNALKVWTLMYTHILENHVKKGEWIFIHYDQLFEKDILKKISSVTEAEIDLSFPDRSLKRSTPVLPVDVKANSVYDKLCKLADFSSKHD